MGGKRKRRTTLRFTGNLHEDLDFESWLELVIGPGSGESLFSSPAERERVWRFYKDQIIAEALPGGRPWAFWQIEAPGVEEADRRAWLRDHGLATPADEVEWAREDRNAAWLEERYAEGLEYNKKQAWWIERHGGGEVKE